MNSSEKYNIELRKTLTHITDELLVIFPNNLITFDYFFVSAIEKKTILFDFFEYIGHDINVKIYNHFNNIIKDFSKKQKYKFFRKDYTNTQYDKILSKILSESIEVVSEQVSCLDILSLLLRSDDSEYVSFFNEIGITISNIDDFRNGVINMDTTTNIEKTKKKQPTQYLNKYTNNLTKQYKQNKDTNFKITGRKGEINRINRILKRKDVNKVILIGGTGCGKTHIVNSLAVRYYDDINIDYEIYEINHKTIVSNIVYKNDIDRIVNGIINEASTLKNVVFFIDDIHYVLYNNIDFGNALLIAVLSSNIPTIMTTGNKEYKKIFENAKTLTSNFQKLEIKQPTIAETESILMESKSIYENYHNITYTDSAIKACVNLANKYITDKELPSSALDILDESGVVLEESSVDNKKIDEIETSIIDLTSLIETNMKDNEFDLAKENKLKLEVLNKEKTKLLRQKKVLNKKLKVIDENHIYQITSEIINIPISFLSKNEKKKYLSIDKTLNNIVIGQEDAVSKISNVIKRSRFGITKSNKPSAIMFFIGESSTGKTLLAKTLAKEIFGSEDYLIRFDMSEYSDKISVNKLIGTSPGYVGFEQGGMLTEAVRKTPYCVLLLDEFEKSDKDVHNMFLQVFDNGILTDNNGEQVSFKNTIIILTSNVGVKEAISFGGGVGFNTNEETNRKDIINKTLKKTFSPEFLNRVDDVVFFKSLTDDNLKTIIRKEMSGLSDRLEEMGYTLRYSNSIINYIFNLVKEDKETGARKINRIIQNNVENVITDYFLNNDCEKGFEFKIEVNNDNNKLIIK